LDQKRSSLLTEKSLAQAAYLLARRDEQLASILTNHGPPPLWRRPTGFTTLVRIILEQQVSLRSGESMFNRLAGSIDPFVPERFIQVGESHLRSLGVTRQKAGYLLHLSSTLTGGDLRLEGLIRMNDADAKLALMRVKGIGSWSADVYLLMAMRRADAWPAGDLALAVAVRDLKGLAIKPSPDELEELAESWRPYRAVAARMLWQYYLRPKDRGRKIDSMQRRVNGTRTTLRSLKPS
jgi:DNA-3-methyladenine glycosylase II